MIRKRVTLIYPKGTFKKSPYYFRGGDVLKEPEYMKDQKRELLANYSRTRKLLMDAQKEYEEAEGEFSVAEEYTNQIAEHFGENSIETMQNSELHMKIEKLQQQLAEVESEIAVYQEKSSYLTIFPLQNENLRFKPEIDSIKNTISLAQSKTKETTQKILSILKSEEYSYSLDTRAEYETAVSIKEDLKSLMSKTFSKVSAKATKMITSQEIDSSEMIAANMKLKELSKLHVQNSQLATQIRLAKIHEQNTRKYLLKQLKLMNEYGKLDISFEKVNAYLDKEIEPKEKDPVFMTNSKDVKQVPRRKIKSENSENNGNTDGDEANDSEDDDFSPKKYDIYNNTDNTDKNKEKKENNESNNNDNSDKDKKQNKSNERIARLPKRCLIPGFNRKATTSNQYDEDGHYSRPRKTASKESQNEKYEVLVTTPCSSTDEERSEDCEEKDPKHLECINSSSTYRSQSTHRSDATDVSTTSVSDNYVKSVRAEEIPQKENDSFNDEPQTDDKETIQAENTQTPTPSNQDNNEDKDNDNKETNEKDGDVHKTDDDSIEDLIPQTKTVDSNSGIEIHDDIDFHEMIQEPITGQ